MDGLSRPRPERNRETPGFDPTRVGEYWPTQCTSYVLTQLRMILNNSTPESSSGGRRLAHDTGCWQYGAVLWQCSTAQATARDGGGQGIRVTVKLANRNEGANDNDSHLGG